MPFTRKQEKYLHANKIKHHHDYRPQMVGGVCQCGDKLTEKKLAKLRKGKYILTRQKKSKEHIYLGNKDILVS